MFSSFGTPFMALRTLPPFGRAMTQSGSLMRFHLDGRRTVASMAGGGISHLQVPPLNRFTDLGSVVDHWTTSSPAIDQPHSRLLPRPQHYSHGPETLEKPRWRELRNCEAARYQLGTKKTRSD